MHKKHTFEPYLPLSSTLPPLRLSLFSISLVNMRWRGGCVLKEHVIGNMQQDGR